jgi:hypothetical protein
MDRRERYVLPALGAHDGTDPRSQTRANRREQREHERAHVILFVLTRRVFELAEDECNPEPEQATDQEALTHVPVSPK